jgi:hypothetical protein
MTLVDACKIFTALIIMLKIYLLPPETHVRERRFLGSLDPISKRGADFRCLKSTNTRSHE